MNVELSGLAYNSVPLLVGPPVVIEPPDSDIPEYLQRTRFIPGGRGVIRRSHPDLRQGKSGNWVENPWVCATPSEFKTKLRNLFSKDYVKSRIQSLLASPTVAETAEPEAGETNLDSSESAGADED